MSLYIVKVCVGCGRRLRSEPKRIPVCSPCRLGFVMKRASFKGRAWLWLTRGAA
jgi:hypothetical protein